MDLRSKFSAANYLTQSCNNGLIRVKMFSYFGLPIFVHLKVLPWGKSNFLWGTFLKPGFHIVFVGLCGPLRVAQFGERP